MPRTILEVRTAKDSLETPEASSQFLASISSILRDTFWQRFMRTQPTLTLELASLNQLVYFIVTVDSKDAHLVRSQIAAHYPTAVITEMEDYLPPWSAYGHQSLGQMVLAAPYYLPIKTYDKSQTTDPMSAVLGIMGRLPYGTAAVIQLVLAAAPKNWTSAGKSVIKRGVSSDPTVFKAHPQQALIEEKLKSKGFSGTIRLLAVAPSPEASAQILSQLASSLGTYALAEGNSLRFSKIKNKAGFLESMLTRSAKFIPNFQVFNTQELSSIYHFPTAVNTGLRNLTWGKTVKGEPPDNLPVDDNLTQEERNNITFYAKTEYKNRMMMYGLKLADRRRHFYALGKSGTGKSTLIAKMAIDDIYKGQGMAVIDPHGDLVEAILLDYIPDHRINDVVYLDPSITDHPFHINPLEVLKPEYKDLTVSNIMSIFTKLWANVWSARMEYILRNTLATLVEVPGSTFLDLPRLLTDDPFRAALLEKIDPKENQVIHDFWNAEYNQYNDKFRNEAIAPILNKVGQFIASPKIRSIVGHPTSTVNIEELMNTGKIVLINLSQGKVGEENAALLGAMFITQFQLAAMNRINILEHLRKDFFLYVDEFQNFATTSFIKILSEARKYRLGLILANQYTAQLEEPIQKAIFGNVGTIVTFVVGADDATRLIGEFGALYTQDDLVNLGKHQIINKVAIENRISGPFPAYTIPPEDHFRNDNRQKVLDASRKQFTRTGKSTIPSLHELYPPSPPALKSKAGSKDTKVSKEDAANMVTVGEVYQGTVTNVKDYGAFVEIVPGVEGLVHVSNLGKKYVKKAEDVVKKGDKLTVKLYEIDDQKRLNLIAVTPDTPPADLPPKPSSTPAPTTSTLAPSTPPSPKRIFTTTPPLVVSTTHPTVEDLDANRQQGLRPTIVGCLIREHKVLLGFRQEFNSWQLPQGGINTQESLQAAFTRQMTTTLGIPADNLSIKDYLGSGRIEFSNPKKKELLTTDSGQTIPMKGKSYFFVSCDAANLSLPEKSGEFDQYRYLTYQETVKLLQSDLSSKSKMILRILQLLHQQRILD